MGLKLFRLNFPFATKTFAIMLRRDRVCFDPLVGDTYAHLISYHPLYYIFPIPTHSKTNPHLLQTQPPAWVVLYLLLESLVQHCSIHQNLHPR